VTKHANAWRPCAPIGISMGTDEESNRSGRGHPARCSGDRSPRHSPAPPDQDTVPVNPARAAATVVMRLR